MKCLNCKWDSREALQSLCDASSVAEVAKRFGASESIVYRRLRGEKGNGLTLDMKIFRAWKKASKAEGGT